jgi:CcmD family protein
MRVKNFWYLFAAYTVIWTALFVYLVYLSQKNQELREELRELQAQVERLLTQREA